MTSNISWMRFLLSLSLLTVLGAPALAHMTPPVVLLTERDAIATMTAGAKKIFAREIRLTAGQREELASRTGWKADEDFYRFYVGRDEAGKLLSAVVFVQDFTIHGPLRIAVALGPDGKVRDARVVEVTEEIYPWLKPLVERDFLQRLAGRDSRSEFSPPDEVRSLPNESMTRFYAECCTELARRAATLFEVTMLKDAGRS